MRFEEAQCRHMPADYMYPLRGKLDAINAAIRVCDGCPAAQECLDFAIQNEERHGVWGGVFMETVRPGHYNRRKIKVAS